MADGVAGMAGRFLFHIYKTLCNRLSFLGLLKHIAINTIFIAIWITTFKNAYRIDSSIRPLIDVNWLEQEDHLFFDFTIVGLSIQSFFAISAFFWTYTLTRRPKISVLAALSIFLLNLLHAGTHVLCPELDVFTWLSYGVLHFASPFLTAFWLWLFAPPGVVSIFAWAFGIQNCLGIMTHLSFPTAAPWYGDQYGYPLPPGNYSMPGSAAGLVRVDAVLGTHIYQNAFKASPLVFGAFPSLHGAFACCCFFFISRYSKRGGFILGFYVMWQWFSTMYLRHHWRIDLLGGFIYSGLVFSLFYRSLQRCDKAHAFGISGGNGWQRLFEGTSLQHLFDGKPEAAFEMGIEDVYGEDYNTSGKSSVEHHTGDDINTDLEAAWEDGYQHIWE